MNELISIIRLINTEGIGPITFYKLIEQFGDAQTMLDNLPKKFTPFPLSNAKQEIELAKTKNIQIISFMDELYPQNLKELEDAPPILYCKGNVELLSHPLAISIVGARNASINGRKVISKISYDLTNADVLTISGMARGIDTAAHKGAMHAKDQLGPTIAVLGTGVDIVYPLENKTLYEQISEQGLIVSEFPIGTEPQANNFPRRNRIVAGLSVATLVGEASINSGSLITARLANEQGKDVFAIPGAPTDTRSSGPNKLIKDGAILVENAEDIINNLQNSNSYRIKELKVYHNRKIKNSSLDKEQKNVNSPKIKDDLMILEHITPDGVDIDDLIRILDSDAATVSVELLNLELSGKIERRTGNKVARKK